MRVRLKHTSCVKGCSGSAGEIVAAPAAQAQVWLENDAAERVDDGDSEPAPAPQPQETKRPRGRPRKKKAEPQPDGD